MSLQYDFDIVPKQAAGGTGGTMILTEARFRNAETVAELHKSPEAVRNWLVAAGFGVAAHPSDVPAGQYAARDEISRLELMQRLTLTMKDFDLPKARTAAWSDFVIADFVSSMARAEPLREPVPVVPEKPAVQIPTAFARKRGKAAKAALAEAAPRGWRPMPRPIPFAMRALARRQGFVMLTLGTAFVYCAVLLSLNR